MDTKTIEYTIFTLLLIIPVILYMKRKPVPVVVDLEKEKCESPIEHRLYNALQTNGYYPVTQVKEGRYRIDIALTTHKIAIECDGKAFHSSLKDKARDRRKDAYLSSKGWKVLRFSGSRIHRDIPGIMERIDREVSKRVN